MVTDNVEEMLTTAMSNLTRSFARTTPIEQTLAEVTAAAVALIGVVDSADVLVVESSEAHRAVAGTSTAPMDLTQMQQCHEQGPCIDAAVGQSIVVCNDVANDLRWPRYARLATTAGVGSVASFQLYTHQRQPSQRAALNLYSRHTAAFDPDAEAIGAMLATHAAIAFIAQDRQHQFTSALASRDAIGQAKGMIMERFDVDALRAFDLMSKLSQDSNTPLVTIAAQIIQRGPDRSPR